MSECDTSKILLAFVQEFLFCVDSFVCVDVFFSFAAPFFGWPFPNRLYLSEWNFRALCFLQFNVWLIFFSSQKCDLICTVFFAAAVCGLWPHWRLFCGCCLFWVWLIGPNKPVLICVCFFDAFSLCVHCFFQLAFFEHILLVYIAGPFLSVWPRFACFCYWSFLKMKVLTWWFRLLSLVLTKN